MNRIYPTYGSEFSITGKFTLPYSLFNGIDYADLKNQKDYKLRYTTGSGINVQATEDGQVPIEGDYIVETEEGSGIYETVGSNWQNASANQAEVDQKRFNWLEYYKVKFKADWYTRVYEKLVLRSVGEFGFMGAYNSDRGLVPFERFYLGGDGLANFSLDGRETIQLRGYPNNSLSSTDGGTVYNKFSLELRYPITLNQSASIYALTFLEAGAAFDDFKDYNPFTLQRSAGVGLRVFMPAFGLLGIDFGHGFDAATGQIDKSGWQTHFIIGQQF